MGKRIKCTVCESENSDVELANGAYIALSLHKDDKGYYLSACAEDETDHFYINVCPVCGRKLATNKLTRNRFKKFIYEKSHINRYLIDNIVDSVCDSHFESEKQLYDMLEKIFTGTCITRSDIRRLDLYS